MNRWVPVCPLSALPDGGAAVVGFDDVRVALFRCGDQVHALDDRCPHMGGSLGEGTVVAGRVTCPEHAWTYDLADGQRVDRTGAAARTHATRVDEEGRIWLRDPRVSG